MDGMNLREIDFLAWSQLDDGLFPVSGEAGLRSAFTAGFAGVIERVDRDHFQAETSFHRLRDFLLGRLWMDLEHVAVVVLDQKGSLLAETNGLNDVRQVLHGLGGGPLGEHWKRIAGENDFAVVDELLHIDIGSRSQLGRTVIAGGKIRFFVELTGDD